MGLCSQEMCGLAVDPGPEPTGVLGILGQVGAGQGLRNLVEEGLGLEVGAAVSRGVEHPLLHALRARAALLLLGTDQGPGERTLVRITGHWKVRAQAAECVEVAGEQRKIPGGEGRMLPGGGLAAGVRQVRGQLVAQVAQQGRADRDAGAEQSQKPVHALVVPECGCQVHRRGRLGARTGGARRQLGLAVEKHRKK